LVTTSSFIGPIGTPATIGVNCEKIAFITNSKAVSVWSLSDAAAGQHREEVARFWIHAPDDALEILWDSVFGEATRLLIAQLTPLTGFSSGQLQLREEVLGEMRQGFNQPGVVKVMIAAFLLSPPGTLQISDPEIKMPAWLLPTYRQIYEVIHQKTLLTEQSTPTSHKKPEEKPNQETSDRVKRIISHISKEMNGVEIAPYFAPLCPKEKGYKCKSVDVFSKQRLTEKALLDPEILNESIERIEEVDFQGSASELWTLLSPQIGENSLDYIVSSHNFEHLPNPIKFLQDCQRLLKPDGVLSMAIPDLRCCFDFFRWPTTLPDMLRAYHQNQLKPDAFNIFTANYAKTNNIGRIGFPREKISIEQDLQGNYKKLKLAMQQADAERGDEYEDIHMSTFTPSSFKLLILELRHLGLIQLEIAYSYATLGNEFLVHMRKGEDVIDNQEIFSSKRKELLMQTIYEIARAC